MFNVNARRRGAFTLIELLVVIAIIGVLAAILVPTVATVIKRAKETQIALEMNQIEAALEDYKMKRGDYPPDMSNIAVYRRHVRKAYSRIESSEFNLVTGFLWTDLNGAWVSKMDPAEALVFWIGGMSANPKRPFTGEGGPLIAAGSGNSRVIVGGNSERNGGAFTFSDERLAQDIQSVNGLPVLISTDETLHSGSSPKTLADPFPTYRPPSIDTAPYVYFDARTYIHNPVNNPLSPRPVYPPVLKSSVLGRARPYRTDTGRAPTPNDRWLKKWANGKTYQIVTAGLDDDFGADPSNFGASPPENFFKLFPSGENYSLDPASDEDNICNFSEGRTLGDSRP